MNIGLVQLCGLGSLVDLCPARERFWWWGREKDSRVLFVVIWAACSEVVWKVEHGCCFYRFLGELARVGEDHIAYE